MANRLASGRHTDFQSEVKCFNNTSTHVANSVDGLNDIAEIFHNEFEALYMSVPYSENEHD